MLLTSFRLSVFVDWALLSHLEMIIYSTDGFKATAKAPGVASAGSHGANWLAGRTYYLSHSTGTFDCKSRRCYNINI